MGGRARAQQLDEKFTWKGAGSAAQANEQASGEVDLENFTWNPTDKQRDNLAAVGWGYLPITERPTGADTAD